MVCELMLNKLAVCSERFCKLLSPLFVLDAHSVVDDLDAFAGEMLAYTKTGENIGEEWK